MHALLVASWATKQLSVCAELSSSSYTSNNHTSNNNTRLETSSTEASTTTVASIEVAIALVTVTPTTDAGDITNSNVACSLGPRIHLSSRGRDDSVREVSNSVASRASSDRMN